MPAGLSPSFSNSRRRTPPPCGAPGCRCRAPAVHRRPGRRRATTSARRRDRRPRGRTSYGTRPRPRSQESPEPPFIPSVYHLHEVQLDRPLGLPRDSDVITATRSQGLKNRSGARGTGRAHDHQHPGGQESNAPGKRRDPSSTETGPDAGQVQLRSDRPGRASSNPIY